jgi:phytoene/squalene synthetase
METERRTRYLTYPYFIRRGLFCKLKTAPELYLGFEAEWLYNNLMEEILSKRRGWAMRLRAASSRATPNLLPCIAVPSQRMRQAAYVIYAICKYSDDSVDEGRGDPREKLAGSEKRSIWPMTLTGIRRRADHRLQQTVYRYAIPKEYFDELIEGMRMDLEKNRYATSLNFIPTATASPGWLPHRVKLLGCDDPDAKAHAVELGIALQLTNILRDIKRTGCEAGYICA